MSPNRKDKMPTTPAAELRSANAELFAAADTAYDRNDWNWYENLSEAELVVLWDSVSGDNLFAPAGPWDDEVFDALAGRGFFDR